MPDTVHAEAIERSATIKIDKMDRDEFVRNLIQEGQDAERDRQTWLEKVNRNYKKRFGIRPSTKNFPWPGAANHHVYLSDEKVRRMKPNYINLAFEGDPIVRFEPVGSTPPQIAQNAEIYMDWTLKYDMTRAPGFNYMESLALIVDDMCGHYGLGIGKVVWHQESRHRTSVLDLDKVSEQIRQILDNPLTTNEELRRILIEQMGLDPENAHDSKQIESAIKQFRSGKRIIKVKEQYVSYKGARLFHVEPHLITVPRDTTHIQTARWIKHDMYMCYNDLMMGQRDGKYSNVEKLEELKPKAIRDFYSTLESTKESREGNYSFTQEESLYKISEFYAYYDIDGDGVGEKVVITVCEDAGDSEPVILRFIEFPYDHGKWPFVVFRNEMTDERYYSSRGLVEMLDHYQTIATNMENHKLDRMTIANSLPLKARLNSINPNNIRWNPAQPIWVKRMDDLESLAIPNVDMSYDQEQGKIRELAETYIGQPDFMMGQMARTQERRTKFEASEMVSQGRQIFSLEARLFKNSLQEMYDQIYELLMQYGDEVTYVRVVGEEKNTTPGGIPIPAHLRLSKEQLRGNFVIVPNGEFTLLSRTLEEQRDMDLLQLALQDNSGAINQLEFWRHALRKKDPRLAKKGLRTDQEFQQIQQMQQQMANFEFQKKMAVAGRTQ